MKQTKPIRRSSTKTALLQTSQPIELVTAIRASAERNRRSLSAEIRPALEREFLTPRRIEDKEKTGSLRKANGASKKTQAEEQAK